MDSSLDVLTMQVSFQVDVANAVGIGVGHEVLILLQNISG